VTPLRDLRHGVRILAKHPTFAMAALSIMALGIGASRGRIVRQLLAEGGVIGVVGVYGVVAYATAGRTREIAVRLALGADARRIVGLVIRDGLGWTVAGISAGRARRPRPIALLIVAPLSRRGARRDDLPERGDAARGGRYRPDGDTRRSGGSRQSDVDIAV
jgi:hypothetical protein